MIHMPRTLPALRPLALGGLAVLFTLLPLQGELAPFALGLLAAARGREGWLVFSATTLTALLFLPFSAALPHMACAVLILTAAAAFRGSPLLRRRAPFAAAAAAITASVGGIYVVQALDPVGELPGYVAFSALTGAAAYFFRPLLQGEKDPHGAVFLAAALALTAGEGTLLGISPALTLLALLLAAVPDPTGGLCLGLMADLAWGRTVCTAAFGLAGAALGLTGRRLARCAAFALAFALLPGAPVGEGLLAALLLLIMPRRLLGGKRVLKAPPPPPDPTPALTAAWKRRMEGAARALWDVYESLSRPVGVNEENPAIIFDRAAERVCRDCALCQLCWQTDYTATFNAMNDATPARLERGRAMAKDFPPHFSARCIHLTDFLTAVSAELSAFLLRRQYRRQLEETRRSARGQYAQLSDLLTATAAGLGERVAAAPCRIGAALRPKEGERVCGDTVVSFPTEEGKWCLLLSDGMGSGEEARKESALVCRLLRQFLESGIAPEPALRTLNAAMQLRGAESGSFTTVDLCVYDPQAGEAAVYKYGAAPSYFKKGGAVRRIAGNSLPVGLRGTSAAPDVTKLPLTPGSFLVMVSDGVADPTRDEWLLDLLAGWDGEDPQSLANLLLAESAVQRKGCDDCGIQVLHCPRETAEEV